MFLDLDLFPFVADLESAWPEIRAEYDRLAAADFVAWPESELYDFGWKAFGMVALGRRLDANCTRCPRTVEAIDRIPGVTSAGFSLLAAGARIRPHAGYTNSVDRLHLGVKVPLGCDLNVAGETRPWIEGKVLAFDDTAEHSAWNNSDDDRVVLLLDVLRPGATFEVTPAALQALEGYARGAQQKAGN